MEPKSKQAELKEFLSYCKEHENSIYVREKDANGNYDSIPLSKLTPQQWGEHVARMWLQKNI